MDVPCEMLLHPELLNNEQLIYIIEQRQLKIPNLAMLHRDDLLDVFHQFCVPFGQRRYRDSGRGKILNKIRHLSPEHVHKFDVIETSNTQNRKSVCNDRVKPPPDLLSGHMKRIKLENKNVPMSNVNVSKRKMSVDEEIPVNTPPKKGRKPITWP